MMKRGFTLIEILVSVAIFSVVMVIALGALLSVSAGERKGETIKSVVNNLDFALESMSRTIRTGQYYHCNTTNVPGSGELTPQDCAASPGSSFFVFKSNDGTNPYVAYCLTDSSIWRTQSANLAGLSTTCGSGSYYQMTAPEVRITNLTFYVNGSLTYPSGGSSTCGSPSGGDCIQPKVVIAVTGYVALSDVGSTTSAFNVQTTITQRLYDQ